MRIDNIDFLKFFPDLMQNDKDVIAIAEAQNKFYKTVVDMKETYFYIDTYNDFLKYFKENDKKEYQRLLKKYCDFIFANLSNCYHNSKCFCFNRYHCWFPK